MRIGPPLLTLALLAGCGRAEEEQPAAAPTGRSEATAPRTLPLPTPPPPAAPATGTVAGRLSYPSDYIPDDMQVCAREVSVGVTSCDSRRAGDRYALTLPPGRYRVWAQTGEDPGTRAFYSEAVRCGLSVECEDHRPITVTVAAGERVSGIDPGDWYAGL